MLPEAEMRRLSTLVATVEGERSHALTRMDCKYDYRIKYSIEHPAADRRVLI